MSSQTVRVRISPTINDDLAARQPAGLPLEKLTTGICELSLSEAQALLTEAEANSSAEVQEVSNAYIALTDRLRQLIAEAG